MIDNDNLEKELKSMEHLFKDAQNRLNAAENEKYNLMMFSSLFFTFILVAFGGGLELEEQSILVNVIAIVFYAFGLTLFSGLFLIAMVIIDFLIVNHINTSKDETIYFCIFALVATIILCFI